jgi:Ca-activated chloride channel family protein
MRYGFAFCCLGLLWTASVHGQGLLVPADKDLAPLAMVNHEVSIQIEDQVAITKVTQTFRNPTSQQLEATYLFPVPKGASVKKFVMWVDGKEQTGELVEAEKARTIYTDIVRRIQDPGLLEYVGSNLLRLRVFPIPAHGDQKLAVSFTSVAQQEDGLVEYVYPLRTSGKAVTALEKFSIDAKLHSQHTLQNIYSPSHAVSVERIDDHHASVKFQASQTVLDKDFQLYYTHGSKDVELTLLTSRPDKDADGTFMLLISPRAELSKKHHVARDMVFVLDTSGSMQGPKIEQAKKALRFCLGSLTADDRFALMNFSTTVNKYAESLRSASTSEMEQAKKWVDKLEANGGTAIDAALDAALATRTNDQSRPFTIVFFTDGQPTVGETNPDKILQSVLAKNTANTRIFTFGVGDDVNAALLDQLADKTRAVSTYVRPAEDIEVKTSGLVGKISHPVLTNLKLTSGSAVTFSEIYPTNLPDLFHGSQLVVLGRYHGSGYTTITLTGSVGKQSRDFVYEGKFPAKTGESKSFVVDLWARRKVGYLLEQIRSNGEKKELVDEVVALAKKHGIATPYTSYLVVPDNVTRPPVANVPADAYQLSAPSGATASPNFMIQFRGAARDVSSPAATPLNTFQAGAGAPASVAMPCAPCTTGAVATHGFADMDGSIGTESASSVPTTRAMSWAQTGDIQTGKLGVDVALVLNEMRNQNQVGQKLVRQAAGRTCCNINGVWADQGFDAKMTQVTIKAMSTAYFRILERHPEMKAVFQLGTQIVWVTPNGSALVIDATKGAETMSDSEIDALFVAKK